MNIWSGNMYILETISAASFLLVCMITIILVIMMVCMIFLTSKKPKEKNDHVTFALSEEKENIIPKERPKADIQSVLDQMENELEQGPKVSTHTFEEEQEEKAVISYRELLKVAGKLKEEIKENEDAMERAAIKSKKQDEKNSIDDKKFKKTEFISPVYGKQATEAKKQYSSQNEDSEDFLSQLKDLRKNLE